MHGLGWIARDLRYAVRSLLKDRGSVALAVLALSLGIGATTVIFSVVYSVMIDAFPFKDNLRVVHFVINGPDGRASWAYYPAPEFAEYRARNHTFSDVLGGVSLEVLYNQDNSTHRVRGAHLDTKALRVLGLTPALGRDMTEEDGAPEAPPAFLMSDRMWNDRFNRDPGVLGQTFKLNGTMRTLIGILPPRFQLHNADVFFPTTFTATTTYALVGGPNTQPLGVWTYARLKDGVTFEQAAADLEVIGRSLAQSHPNRYPDQFTFEIIPLRDAYTSENMREMVYILTGAVLLLLLIACSNVANLLLARATGRETELAVRASLGASRGRLMRHLLAESFVLAAAGAATGAFLAYAGIQWVRAAIPANALPAEMSIRFSSLALLAAVGVAMPISLACGLAPALRAARGDLQARLTGTGKGAGLRTGNGRVRTLLVTVQVTLAIALLVGAGLMMRTLLAIQSIELGLNPKNVLVGRLAMPIDQRQTPAERTLLTRQVIEKLRAIPGVVAASPSFGFPLQGGPTSRLTIPGTTPTENWIAALEFVGDEYFQAAGLPLVTGRVLSAADVEGARKVVVVNREFAREFLGDASPVGRTVTLAAIDRGAPPDQRSLFEIVGVVGDTRNRGLQNEARAQVYLPYTASPFPTGAFVLRTAVEPLSLVQSVRQQIWAVDPGVALMNEDSLEGVLHRAALAAPTFGVGLMGTFAAIGLILAAIGVFSVMGYTVSLQTHDIGIRMALGAHPSSVMRTTLLRGLRPIVVGVVIGLVASYWLSRFMESHIYGVTATDPWTFGGVAVALTAVGMVACALPARKAMRVDPLVALRYE
jgi:putative ABC transport system permease protein